MLRSCWRRGQGGVSTACRPLGCLISLPGWTHRTWHWLDAVVRRAWDVCLRGDTVPQEVRLGEEGRKGGPWWYVPGFPFIRKEAHSSSMAPGCPSNPRPGPRCPFLGTLQPYHACMPQSLARAFSARLQQEQGQAHRKPEQHAPCFHYLCFKNYKKTCPQNKVAARSGERAPLLQLSLPAWAGSSFAPLPDPPASVHSHCQASLLRPARSEAEQASARPA